MECLASQAKSSHVKASIKTMIKLLTCDQGPAFQAHSLQITLLGPITHEPNVILGLLNNRVLTPSIKKKKNRYLFFMVDHDLSDYHIDSMVEMNLTLS